MLNSGTSHSNLLVGFDLILIPESLISPHLGLNVGIIGERGGGPFGTYNVQTGLQVKTSKAKNHYIRLALQLAKHSVDDDSGKAFRGPITNTVGYVLIF